MHQTRTMAAMQTLSEVPRKLRRKRAFSEENTGQPGKTKKGQCSAMGEVIEMKLPLDRTEAMYVTGKTLLTIARACGRILFDVDGTPVLESEFYEVTSEGISRVA